MSYVKVADLKELEPDTPYATQVGSDRLVLVRVGDEVFAVSATCTHEDEPLGEGFVEDCAIECPRHGAQFDLKSGDALSLPAVKPLATYPVRVDGEAVLVDVTEPHREAL